jgi:hypothetical protein
MTIFGDGGGRGCFLAFNVATQQSRGAMLSLPSGDTVPMPNITTGLIVTGVGLGQSESLAHMKCFGDAIYTYVFGANVGDLSVNFLAFLCAGRVVGDKAEPAGQAGGGAFKTALKYYADNRISKSRKYAVLSMGDNGGTLSGQVVSLQGNVESTENNIYAFSLGLKLTSVAGGT